HAISKRDWCSDVCSSYLDLFNVSSIFTIRDKKDLEKEVEELNEKVEHFVKIEDTLNKSIVIAQDTAEELKANAHKEAKLIIKEAEKNADRIINEALGESRKIAMETEELKRQAKVFRTRMK